MPITDWDTAYSNRLAVTDSAALIAAWSTQSEAFARQHDARLERDLAYGRESREAFDVYHPEGDVNGTLILFHGGYWRALSKNDHHHFAAGALARGWRVVIADYPLCPTVRMSHIASCATQAIEVAVTHWHDAPVVLAGHSAGGQLVSYVVSEASGLSDAARRYIKRVVSISGVHDLRPLLNTTDLNDALRLDEQEAIELSPALGRPGHSFELVCACGGGELDEFRRQNALLANVWTGFGLDTRAIEYAGYHHFSVMDLLADAESELTRQVTLAT
ncbi:alpha/beta hydrolase [Phytohalomonas tamaricis]|uniref:alpha/beta hydrolase n=1 Tax=Phytohalomonas tamaricis TaxID=2081032 RepID=UPI00131A27D6|nr:alpha/beta hydrolase [Phytohalomonas tamaricis]